MRPRLRLIPLAPILAVMVVGGYGFLVWIFRAGDSLECRNCHGEAFMDFTRQSPRAAEAHEQSLVSGEKTCIDCHEGIAHRLPDISGIASR